MDDAKPFDRSASPTCRVCSRPSVSGSFLCERCRRLRGRGAIKKPDSEARLRAMSEQYDPATDTFRCYFTDVELNDERWSWRKADWEHLSPGDESSVVLASALINRMKANLTEPQFEELIAALAEKFRGGPFRESAFPTTPGSFSADEM
jgi:hypothetical protein